MANRMTAENGFSVNPDLQSERDTSTIDTREITYAIDGGKEKFERRKELESLLFNDPLFHIRNDIFLSTHEQYTASLERSVKLLSMKRNNVWNDDDFSILMRILRHNFSFGLHQTMFIPAIERLATEEQKAKWLPLAKSWQIIGTYAQTELGHGTYLMGLETTATYDAGTQEFVLTTPHQSSIKWWPGQLGKTANVAIVLAQLVIGGTKYGMHPFLLQLRSFEDHTLMPGIRAGHIGPKMAGNNSDNGFLYLDNVRIPRTNMLMKNAQVTNGGKFITSGPSKANYATMVYVRVQICLWCTGCLGAAITSAIRYSAVRRQSTFKPGTTESKILDYQTQQYKLFPSLTIAYGAFLIYKLLSNRYDNMLREIHHGNYKSLPEMHAVSSGMKALLSDLATRNIETVRRACGGHGYLRSAGIADLVVESYPLATVEGDNTVLYLQVARYLLKQMAKALSGQTTTGSTAYLSMNPGTYTCPLQTKADCRNLDYLCELYKKRAYSTILTVAQTLQGDIEGGKEQYIAMNNNLQYLVKAATAHSYLIALSDYIEGVNTIPVSPPCRKVLGKLCSLFAVHHIVTLSGDFLETEALGLEQLHWLQDLELQLLAEIRPEAVGLVDAFDFHDETLSSAIGCWDGQAYERLYEWALKDALNKQEVDPSYHKYLKEFMQQGAKSKL